MLGDNEAVIVEIWSDIICPWCYVGEARFATALAGFEHRGEVEVHHRSFELDPSTPRGQVSSVLDLLAAKFGGGRDQVLAMEDKMAAMAAAEGLGYTADRPTGNTYDAHQILHLAADRGIEDDVRSAMWSAHFGAGRSVFTPDDLAAIVVPAGLDADEVKKALAEDTYWEAVRTDEKRATELGITGVPFFVLGDVSKGSAIGISGAQSTAHFADALTRTHAESHPA